MKLLYLSCHAILEYDELKLFEELGIDYFSLGSYVVPTSPVDPIRPALKHKPDPWLLANAPDKNHLTQEFVDKFDVIVVMHVKEWLIDNWDLIRRKTVIWRTIGQSTQDYERALWPLRQDGLKVVRYSKREANIKDSTGCDMIIPFYKDPNEFKDWNGVNRQAITVVQNMKGRGEFCNYDPFIKLIDGLPAKLYGTNNNDSGDISGGYLTYDEMRQIMRDNRVYIYTGTQPACYTLNFIEAMMTGIPIVALGASFGNSLNIAGDLYEIPDIIQHGVNGFISDDLQKLKDCIEICLEDKTIAKRIGEMGRQTAVELFGKDMVKAKWQAFFDKYLTNTIQ